MAKTHTSRGSFPTLVGTDTKALAASRIETKRAIRTARVPGKGKLIVASLYLIAEALGATDITAAVARFEESKTEEEQRAAFAEVRDLVTADGSFSVGHLITLLGGLSKLIDKRFPAE